MIAAGFNFLEQFNGVHIGLINGGLSTQGLKSRALLLTRYNFMLILITVILALYD